MFRKLALSVIAMVMAFGAATAEEKLVELDVNKIPGWMKERIDKELSYYKDTGISFEDLNNIEKNAVGSVVFFEIIDNKLHYDKRKLSGKWMLARDFMVSFFKDYLLTKYKIPNVKFYLNVHESSDVIDGLYDSELNFPPIFTFTKNKAYRNSKKYILFVDDFTVANRGYGYWEGWRSISKEVLLYNKKYPWNTKKSKLFWRGKKSDYFEGGPYQTPRQTLIDLSIKYPDMIDASFHVKPTVTSSKVIEKIYGVRDFIMKKLGVGGFVKNEEFHKYKVLVNVDGSTSTFPGFLQRLLSNSVTIKQETDNEQWFYDAVKPWVHYVPVKKDLSDLIEKIEWIKNNDAEAKKIADQSTEFVQNNLMMGHIDMYIVALLTEYARLQQFKLDKLSIEK